MNDLVSIGITIYNGEKTLERSISSILNQTYKNLEVIISDDNSLDKSKEIIESKFLSDKRVIFNQNKKNIGLTENCNLVFNMSRGTYFFWADQDDFREKTYIEECVDKMSKHKNASLCHSITSVFYKDPMNIMHKNNLNSIDKEKSVAKRYWKFLRNYNDVNICGFMRSDKLKETNLWKPINGSANNLLFELILLGEFIQIEKPLFNYSGQSLYDRPNALEEYSRQSREKNFIRYPFISLLINQIIAIISIKNKLRNKIIIIFLLLIDTFLVNFGKLIFRTLNLFIREDRIPNLIINFCLHLSYNNKDIDYVIKPESNTHYYPKFYPLKKII